LYPGDLLLASAWSDPRSYAPLSYLEQVMLQGFTPVVFSENPAPGAVPVATRIIVPSIGVDSTVEELEILDFGGSRAYETPDHTVGHIPETANAGEAGASWFFGHTESPTLGEGSVFFNLQQIPQKLRNGEDVFIITDNGRSQFLYRATASQVVHQSEMRLYDTGKSTIHLVSCVPRLVYDHRLIVTGELVAQKGES
jgi:LPXTG-site transpeptidase (sortase) family protein